jgi:hypothetical protein
MLHERAEASIRRLHSCEIPVPRILRILRESFDVHDGTQRLLLYGPTYTSCIGLYADPTLGFATRRLDGDEQFLDDAVARGQAIR